MWRGPASGTRYYPDESAKGNGCARGRCSPSLISKTVGCKNMTAPRFITALTFQTPENPSTTSAIFSKRGIVVARLLPTIIKPMQVDGVYAPISKFPGDTAETSIRLRIGFEMILGTT